MQANFNEIQTSHFETMQLSSISTQIYGEFPLRALCADLGTEEVVNQSEKSALCLRSDFGANACKDDKEHSAETEMHRNGKHEHQKVKEYLSFHK